MTREEVLEKVSKKREEFISWYHEFHQIPELGFEEKETTELICEKLTGMGIHPLRLDPTGVTAYIGPHDAYTVGLRADIDGLRVLEDTDLPFQSKHPGKMHACGHDGHITGLLGAASILKEMESELTVRVKLIFQPSEENTKGAKQIISQGILEDVDEVFGLHLFSDIKAGEISVEPGARMAQTDRFTITFIGKGGHAAKPHQCVDATVMAADFVINDVALSRRIADEAEQLLENRKLVHIAPLMLGEDFSWYQKEVPGVFAFVGCGTPGRKCYPNHHPKFEVEESALSDGVLLHLAAVVSAMHREKEE